MTPRWLMAFAVVLALAFCGTALAGPKAQDWGDPDIFEGTKPKGLTPREQISGDAGLSFIVLDVPIYHRFIQVQHEHGRKLDPVPTRRISVALRKNRVGR